jgi:predicted transcriptional regulator
MGPIRATVKADDSLVKALFVMVKENVGMMPVLDNGRVAGMVRLTDLFLEVSQAIIEKTTPELS